MSSTKTARVLLLVSCFLCGPLVAAPLEKQEAMIPARDGVRLYTEIWRDKSVHDRLPFLIVRTPYGASRQPGSVERGYAELVADGYIFIFQDIRGRYKSEGQFVMNRPPRATKTIVDEGTDTYDTIDWLLKNVPENNGHAGITGISYGGFLTQMALVEPHPALKAASEQASPGSTFMNDDFFHNGAFRLSYGFEYSTMMET
jgi:putative CocE/NonD family hydrolase